MKNKSTNNPEQPKPEPQAPAQAEAPAPAQATATEVMAAADAPAAPADAPAAPAPALTLDQVSGLIKEAGNETSMRIDKVLARLDVAAGAQKDLGRSIDGLSSRVYDLEDKLSSKVLTVAAAQQFVSDVEATASPEEKKALRDARLRLEAQGCNWLEQVVIWYERTAVGKTAASLIRFLEHAALVGGVVGGTFFGVRAAIRWIRGDTAGAIEDGIHGVTEVVS